MLPIQFLDGCWGEQNPAELVCKCKPHEVSRVAAGLHSPWLHRSVHPSWESPAAPEFEWHRVTAAPSAEVRNGSEELPAAALCSRDTELCVPMKRSFYMTAAADLQN